MRAHEIEELKGPDHGETTSEKFELNKKPKEEKGKRAGPATGQ